MKPKIVKTLTIDRRYWGRGEDFGKLLNPQTGKMCCLGFYCLRLGLKKDQIIGKTMPAQLANILKLPEFFGWLIIPSTMTSNNNVNTTDCAELSRFNDAVVIDDNYREEKIIEIFAKHGVKVRFVN